VPDPSPLTALVFTIKSFVVPIASLGIVIWATKANGGVSSGTIETPASKGISTTAFAFSVMAQFNSVMGSNSALIVTVPDLARYARNGRHQMYGQLVDLPLSIICAAFGCITTVSAPLPGKPDLQSAVLNMWGTSCWNLYDLLNGILDEQYTPKARAGVFFASAVWAFATFCTSVACNITRKR
jgi:NCS1 family nucleobase:cation symporter-1